MRLGCQDNRGYSLYQFAMSLSETQEESNHRKDIDLWLPAALILVGVILTNIPGLSILVWLLGMGVHEIGHAFIFWLRSIPAIPTFAMAVPLTSSSSILCFVFLLALFGWGLHSARKLGYRIFQGLMTLLLIATFLFTWVFSERFGEMVMIYAGLGGEFFISAIFFLIFFENWGKGERTIKLKYFLLGLGAIVYVSAIDRWIKIKFAGADLPYGGLLDFGKLSSGESGGDLDRLVRDFGWNDEFIVLTMLMTGVLSGLVMIFSYAAFLCLKIGKDKS